MSPNLTTKKRGEFFRKERIKKKFTQKYVGKELGFSSGWLISKMERGLSGIPMYTVRRLIELYETEPTEVISFDISLYVKTFNMKEYSRRNMLIKYDEKSKIKIGKFIEKKRVEAGLSKIGLSRNLNYETSKRVSNWEKGRSDIPDFLLKPLSDALCLKEGELEKFLMKEAKNTLERSFDC